MTTTYYQGREVRILATDTDPTAAWWICFVDAPDTDAFVMPTELVSK